MAETLRQTYLDPAVLERLGDMHIRARGLVEGVLAGLHRSPHRGGSVEFAEYVEYSPGHEIRHIDWKVYAKSDKYYVKQFEDETNLKSYLVLDGSGSMNFASDDAPLTKLRYASFLAAVFAYLFMHQGDAVGALSFDEKTHQFLPASSRTSHLDDIFNLLENLHGAGDTSLTAALRSIAERTRGRSLVLLFSDMLDADAESMNLARVLRKRHYDVSVFHVVDPAEVTLPYEGLTLFEGLENEGKLLVEPDDLRERYLTRIRQHMDWVRTQCEEGDIDYHRFLTTDPIEEVCLRFLRGRM